MQRLSVLLLALVWLGISGFLSVPPAPAPEAPDQKENTLLWEISGKGLGRPSYLYGTIHLICPHDFFLANPTKEKLAQTERLALEIDLSDPTLVQQLQGAALGQTGGSLKKSLSQEDYAALNTFFKKNLGMDLRHLDSFTPIMLTSLLLSQLIDCTPQSYEAAFLQLAKEQNKPLVGLETVQDQLEAFGKIALPAQSDLLVQTVKDLEESKEQFREMVKMYRAQDLQALDKLIKKVYDTSPTMEDALFTQRNQRWIPVMEKLAREKPTFFAVGVAHLSGDQGVIALLRKQGYTVKPVPNPI
jgi:uncharacterized protein YbaP (TraB family)